MSEELFATLGQAAVLVAEEVGWKVDTVGLRYIATELAKDGRISDSRSVGGEWRFSPGEVDRLVGEVWRRRAGWARRGNVSQGFEGWVLLEWWGRKRLLLLPWERESGAVTIPGAVRQPERIVTSEWPTGRVTGALRRSEGLVDGLPVYVWESVDVD